MSGIGITVTVSGGERFAAADGSALVQQAGQRLAKRLADATLAAALPHVPGQGGPLAQSGHVEDQDDGAAVVFDAPYAPFVHGPMDGAGGRTQPHWPPWGPGSALAGWAERQGIPAFLVARAISRHGTPMVPFLTDAARAVMADQFPQLRQAALDELTAALSGGS